jgi:hypothetical protein
LILSLGSEQKISLRTTYTIFFTYGNVLLEMPGNIVSLLEELARTKAAGEQLSLKA